MEARQFSPKIHPVPGSARVPDEPTRDRSRTPVLRALASSKQRFRPNSTSEAAAMTKCLLYVAPIAFIGLMATQASAAPAALSGSMARAIADATAERSDAPLVLVRGGRGGGGGGRGGGGGGFR